MKLKEILKFKRELFFEGAIQLDWLDFDSVKADLVAKSYIFHGPSYIEKNDTLDFTGIIQKDTATFLKDILEKISFKDTPGYNPFEIAIAGYGSGKSHFAVTLTKLLASYPSDITNGILENLASIDERILRNIIHSLANMTNKNLVIAIDGMKNFDLNKELYKKVIRQLRKDGLDITPLLELSPRFNDATEFFKRNFKLRKADFEEEFGKKCNIEDILLELNERNEETYGKIDRIFTKVVGRPIPIEGSDSPQEFINVLCSNYCGSGKYYNSLVVLFDEFGRYLEYSIKNPHLVSHEAIQQLFEGIQNNASLCYFLAFIQYDLKTYLNLVGQREVLVLQRYLTRFDSAKKSYISSNLETLIANLIHKNDEKELTRGLTNGNQIEHLRQIHSQILKAIPKANNYSVWNNFDSFLKVIVIGCFPLHPLTVWFLTRLQNLFQSRSAISFIEETIDKYADVTVGVESNTFNISISDVLSGSLFSELLKSEDIERETISQQFILIKEKYYTKIEGLSEKLLLGIVAATKMKIRVESKSDYDKMLVLISGLTKYEFDDCMSLLVNELSIIEWNEDSKKYDIFVDAATRSEFVNFLRKSYNSLEDKYILEVIQKDVKTFISPRNCEFGNNNNISVQEWNFEIFTETINSIENCLINLSGNLKESIYESTPRGKVIYCYLPKDKDISFEKKHIKNLLDKCISDAGFKLLPIYIVILTDDDNDIAEKLVYLHIIERKLTPEQKNKFRNYLDIEKESCTRTLIDKIEASILKREIVFPGDIIIQHRLNEVERRLFEIIYTNVIPFPFDGFSTPKGNAAKDCAEITRAVIVDQLSKNWLSAKEIKMQNRVKTLLRDTWGSYDGDFIRLQIPTNIQIRKILDELNGKVQKLNVCNLNKIFEYLVLPPFGNSVFAAQLIIAHFISGGSPSKELVFKGEPISLDEWVNKAFKKYVLDKEILIGTEVRRVEDTVKSRWKKILDELAYSLEYESYYEIKNKFLEVLDYKSKVTLVADFIDKYNLLVAKASNTIEEYKKYDNFVNKLYEKVDGYIENQDILNLTYWASNIKKNTKNMKENIIRWRTEEINELEPWYNKIIEYVKLNYEEWLKKQIPRSVRELDRIRDVIDKVASNLEAIDLKRYAQMARSHYAQVCENIEELQKIKMAQTRAEDLLGRKHFDNYKYVELKNLQNEIEETIKYLEKLNRVSESINNRNYIIKLKEHITVIKNNQACLIEKVNSFKELKVSSASDIVDLVNVANDLLTRFINSEYYEHIKKYISQLNGINTSINKIEKYEQNVEEFESIYLELVKQDALTNEGKWNLENIYHKIFVLRRDALIELGQKWMIDNIPNKDKITNFKIDECNWQLRKLDTYPAYISKAQIKTIENSKQLIFSRLDEIDVDNLIARIQKLSVEKLNKIYKAISELLKSKKL